LGVIESQKRAGPRIKKIEPLLDAVEWAMVAFLKPAMNARKVKWPKDPVIVRNRWYSIEDDSHFEEPVAIWPDVIDFAGSFAPAYLVWLKSQRTVAIRNPRMFLETTQ